MIKQSIFLIVSWILASAFAFQPTPIQQFLVIPANSLDLDSPAWHIGDDIISFYQEPLNDLNTGYLKITPSISYVERILSETVSSCQGDDISLLDPSYYHPSTGTFLYYCIANNSLLIINQNYTVQDALPISTSQTFSDVIIGHNEQGYVYILGLPDLMSLPAKTPTELILVDLKTKAVENHVIFNKGSDSKGFVTGYAFDSGSSYILTKELEGALSLVRISKIVLSGNDYELTPFANFTYLNNNPQYSFHNPLHIIDEYFFTNDNYSLLIFDKNGNLNQAQQGLNFWPMMKDIMTFERLFIPQASAQIAGSTLYASLIMSQGGLAYSLQNGKMTSKKIDESSGRMLVAIGGLTSGDLLIGLNDDTFNIRDAKTNTTLYSSFRGYDDIMMSESHFGVLSLESFYVFDRKNPRQLPQRISINGYSWLDRTTNLVVALPFSPMADIQVAYTDLETLKTRNGPTIPNAAWGNLRHVNLTDLARPFFVTNPADRNHYFISPATYGTIYWKCPNFSNTEGIVLPGNDAESFTYVWNLYGEPNLVNVDAYKYDKTVKSFVIKGSYPLTTNQTQQENTKYFNIGNNKVVLAHAKNITVVDLVLKTFKISDVPALYDSPKGVGILYDKNKTPYLSLAEVKEDGDPATSPQLFDFTSVTTMPGVIPDLTRTATVVGNCSYALVDEFDNTIKVVRLYDICQAGGQEPEKINI